MYTGECDSASAELKEAQKAGAELMQDREELNSQLAGLQQQLADMTQAHDELKCALVKALVLLWQTTSSPELSLCYALTHSGPLQACV